jgi:hypothetical protein
MRVFGVLCIVGILLFAKLGHYALWDDEANTALTGKAILKTGDTSASVDGRNFLMYRQGTELEELKNRYLPPLGSCLAATSFLFFEPSACSARLPFSVIGFLGIAFFLILIWRLNIPSPFLIVFVILLLSNVALYLFLRNCRYYAPALLFTVFVIALYRGTSGSRMQLMGLSLAGFFLAAAQYLNYAALVFALSLDYVFYRRLELTLSVRKWILLLVSQVVMVGALLAIFNPIGKKVVTVQSGNWVAEKLQLLWWNFRDLDACQFGSLPILLLGFLFVFRGPHKDSIKRLGIGCLAYIAIITILSPQPVRATSVADVRYLASLIPILIALESLIICSVFQFQSKFALLCAALLSFTNILSLDFITQRDLKFPLYSFVRELIDPPRDPYSETAAWIRKNISAESSIWVLPEHMVYPLMFHAPDSVYAWQLDANQRKEGQFSALPPIHFKGVIIPEFIIVFGPMVVEVREMLKQWKMEGVNFENVSTIDVFWKDLYRPELFWRSSEPIPVVDKQKQGIYVFKRVEGVKSL